MKGAAEIQTESVTWAQRGLTEASENAFKEASHWEGQWKTSPLQRAFILPL